MKKFITLFLSCFLIFSITGCSNKNETVKQENQTATSDQGFMDSYGELYNTNLNPLTSYSVYTNLQTAQDAFKDKDYPGNKEYLKEVRSAYEDSRNKVQAFIDGLKNDIKTNDTDLQKRNDVLIKEGEKLVKEIDKKIAKLDEIKESDFNKPQDEFIKLVYDKTNEGEHETNEFNKKLKEMNDKLGITPKTNTNPAK